MEALLESTIHIEASDFDENWRLRSQTGPVHVPLRAAFKQVGLITTTATDGHAVRLCWSSHNGRVQHRQVIARRTFQSKEKCFVCLRCPKCRKSRTRLFLVSLSDMSDKRWKGGNWAVINSPATYQFICKKCSGLWNTPRWPRSVRKPRRRKSLGSK